jgi:Family of unknown function (DUF5675)
MKLELARDQQTRQGTIGYLFLDASDAPPSAHLLDADGVESGGAVPSGTESAPFCVTLERPAARFGDLHPCIPAGEYCVVLYHSPHFARLMPLLEGVPGRSGIEIHWGNFVRDFEGCIGVGAWRGQMPDGSPTIWNTRATFDQLFARLETAFAARREGPAAACTIMIRDPQPRTNDAPRNTLSISATDREIDAHSM